MTPDEIERAINPPGRWTPPPTKVSLEPGSVPEGFVTATECQKAWLLTQAERDQLEAIISQMVEPLRARLQRILDGLDEA